MWDAARTKALKEEAARESERVRQDRCEAARKSTEPLSLWPDHLKAAGTEKGLVQIEMRLGALQVGWVIVNDRPNRTLWIADIWVFEDLRLRHCGRDAIAALTTIARGEGYARVAGEVEPGEPEVVCGRQIFFEKCGFIVRKDRSMEMDLTSNAS